ncbi:MAG: radical SAM protein, partial [Planctomycetota bacterium]
MSHSTTSKSTEQTLDPRKFVDPLRTADGQPRGRVPMTGLRTLWFNTGTLCNLSCVACYIESTPSNDRLAYLTPGDVRSYLDEIASLELPTRQIGFTGGEPFLNPDFLGSLTLALERGFEVL